MKNLDFLDKVNNPLRKKSFLFAVRIVKLHQFLVEEKKEYVISKQVLRCGTNPGAMSREADNAESSKDFIHKLSIAQKELSETQYWLELLYVTDFLNEKEFCSLHEDAEELLRIVSSAIITKKKRLRSGN